MCRKNLEGFVSVVARKKVLAIGGSGFLGKATVEKLLELDFDVTVYDLSNPNISNVTFVEGCISDKEKLQKSMKAVDYVFHFAGWADMLKSSTEPAKVIEMNVIGTTNVLEACVKNNIEKFIFASSMYVFSNNGSFYRASKQCCELLIEEYSKTFGLRFCILRYGSLYGPGATHGNAVYELISQALVSKQIKYWGTGEEVRQYIHVKDAAKGSVQVLDKNFKEKYVSLTGLEDIQIKKLLNMINEILGGGVKIETSSDPSLLTHYLVTPFNFMPKTGCKLVFSDYKDLGQGVLECIHEIYEKLNEQR